MQVQAPLLSAQRISLIRLSARILLKNFQLYWIGWVLNISVNVKEGAGKNMDNALIIALDFANGDAVGKFLLPFSDHRLFVKVGMELYYQEGPSIIQLLKEAGHQIFLDLKLHDIPNTVRSAMKGLARFEVDLVNVHAA